MNRVKHALKIILLGGLGFFLAGGLYVVGLHLWQDHNNLHALVGIELQREQQQGVANGPVKASPPPAATQ